MIVILSLGTGYLTWFLTFTNSRYFGTVACAMITGQRVNIPFLVIFITMIVSKIWSWYILHKLTDCIWAIIYYRKKSNNIISACTSKRMSVWTYTYNSKQKYICNNKHGTESNKWTRHAFPFKTRILRKAPKFTQLKTVATRRFERAIGLISKVGKLLLVQAN